MSRSDPPSSWRLDPETRQAIRDLATEMGISEAAVLRMAVRQLAQRQRRAAKV